MARVTGVVTAVVVFIAGVATFAALNSLRLGWREKEVWLVAAIAVAAGVLVERAHLRPGARDASVFVWLAALTPPIWVAVFVATWRFGALPMAFRVILAASGCVASLAYLSAGARRASAAAATQL